MWVYENSVVCNVKILNKISTIVIYSTKVWWNTRQCTLYWAKRGGVGEVTQRWSKLRPSLRRKISIQTHNCNVVDVQWKACEHITKAHKRRQVRTIGKCQGRLHRNVTEDVYEDKCESTGNICICYSLRGMIETKTMAVWRDNVRFFCSEVRV